MLGHWRLLSAGLIGLNVLTAIYVVYVTHTYRSLFVELNGLEQARDALNIEWGQLQLEQSTFASHSELELTARQRLNMRLPPANKIEVIN